MMKKQLALQLLILSLVAISAAADPSPRLIPFQGRLTDQNGVAYTNGQFTILFQLYNDAVGGAAIWSERHEKVGVINGTVNVFLGSINSLDAVTFDQTKHLGITVDADNNPNTPDPEMVPRQMIIPSFWSKYSENSTKLGGYSWSDILVGGGTNPATGKILGGKIETGGITGLQIAANAITATQIANNTITAQQLAGAIITSNQIVAGAISSQNLADGSVTFSKTAGRSLATNFAGLGGIVLSSPVSVATTLSLTNVAIPNLTVGLVCGGRPVRVECMPAQDSGSLYPGSFYFNGGADVREMEISLYRGNTKVVGQHFGFTSSVTTGNISLNTRLPASALQFTDYESPIGTNIYTVRWRTVNGVDLYCNDVRIVAYEW